MIVILVLITETSLPEELIITVTMMEMLIHHLPRNKRPFRLRMTIWMRLLAKLLVMMYRHRNHNQRKTLSRIEEKYFNFGLTKINEIQPVP